MAGNNTATNSYGQYCPLALTAELLCRRWTLLVVSRLIDGCTTFNEIHQGVPRISPSLLSQRLTELEHAGLVKRRKQRGSNRYDYEPTQACMDLDGIITDLAVWGQHWARDMVQDDLDVAFLAWSMHLRIDASQLPPGRTVMHFEFSGVPNDCRHFWLVCDGGKIDMCLKHPGYDSDLHVSSDIRRFVDAWRGFRDLREEIRAKRIRVSGPKELKKAFPGWLMLSMFSTYDRKATGREQRLSRRSSN